MEILGRDLAECHPELKADVTCSMFATRIDLSLTLIEGDFGVQVALWVERELSILTINGNYS